MKIKKEYQISDLVMSREKMVEELKKVCSSMCIAIGRYTYYGSDKIYPQLNRF